MSAPAGEPADTPDAPAGAPDATAAPSSPPGSAGPGAHPLSAVRVVPRPPPRPTAPAGEDGDPLAGQTLLDPALAAALLERVTAEEARLSDLEAAAYQGGGWTAVAGLHLLLQRLLDARRLALAVGPSARRLAELRPRAAGLRLLDPTPADGAALSLSPFAYLRVDEADGPVLETPLGTGVLRLTSPAAWLLLQRLSAGTTAAELAGDLPAGLPDTTAAADTADVAAFVALLAVGGFLAAAEPSTALREWEFHDLLFHARSRLGRHDQPMGGTYRFEGRLEPTPVLKPNPWGARAIPLPRPPAGSRPRYDTGLVDVVERRRSVRDHGAVPITVDELGEFLYRAARVRSVQPFLHGPLSNRPYPNGGASYELEIYLTVDRCVGLPPGFYYYDPAAHAVCLVSPPNADTLALLRGAYVSSALTCWPQVLLTFGSRFGRVSWKYTGIAYATQLKNVGALYAVMYLVATAMGLAPCGLGLGDSTTFCRLTGTSWLEEGSIGEFMLGSTM